MLQKIAQDEYQKQAEKDEQPEEESSSRKYSLIIFLFVILSYLRRTESQVKDYAKIWICNRSAIF